ncbi:U6 snRNA phosphodiesterase 1 [Parasteatoda tepidariorum]|uniref:U6 snRNA phosphodiesterase 1 n=1 Tax=Parasteatoda tepidariorum TaxID=114398 RepID=UPI001C725E97|nr:U6 snRNA phosphodiesterase-like [Parasteatoda tepidariorum]
MSLRLVDYSSDEEQSFDEINKTVNDSSKENVENTSKGVTEPLPLPFEIQDMFSNNVNHTEDPSKHGGKIRSFPHERGVWATHVFIESYELLLFQLRFDSLEVYENEEKTRTFLGLKIHYGHDALTKLVERVDSCLAEFQLPCFYEEPSFHLSFASCVGSKSQIIESFLANLNIVFQVFVKNNPCFRTLNVTKIHCKSGNKLFTTSLKT